MNPLALFIYHTPAEVARAHLGLLRQANPFLPVVPLCGDHCAPLPGLKSVVDSGVWLRRNPWENSDQIFYDWWLQDGILTVHDCFILVQYDTRVEGPLIDLFGPKIWDEADFAGCHPHSYPDEAYTWQWFSEIHPAPPERIKPYLRGLTPFTGIFIRRRAWERAFTHLLHDPLFRGPIDHDELRLPTAMCKAGVEAVGYDHPGIRADARDIPAGNWPFVHPVKQLGAPKDSL